jgi:uncharacterized membrane protein YbhN (UPF0104 family)
VQTAPKGLKFTANKKLLYFLKLGLAALLLWMLVHKIDPHNLKMAFLNAQFRYIFLAFILVIPNIYVQFLKWRYLLRLAKPEVTNFEASSSLFAGFALGFVTPGRIGEFGRALFIDNCSRTQVVGLAMIDKLFAMLVVLVAGAFGLLFLVGTQLNSELIVLWYALTFLSVGLVFFLTLFPEHLHNFILKIKNHFPVNKRIDLLVSSLDNFRRPQAIRMLALASLFYAIMTTQFVLLFSAFEKLAIVYAFLVVFSIFITKSLLPISLGDLGIRESAAVFFIGLIGGAQTTAFNASILIFLFNLAIPSLVGLVLMLTPRLNQKFLNFKMTNGT